MLNDFSTNKFKTADNISIHCRIAGSGRPLLLLHGHPQTHVMWHKIAPNLIDKYQVILADLRGYGDSDKPKGEADHSNYSKRVMGEDMAALMESLGHNKFSVIGHDRGARVAYRMALNFKEKIEKLVTIDVLPTYSMYSKTGLEFATSYWHWFFLIRPFPFPENSINHDPEIYLNQISMGRNNGQSPFTPEARKEYLRCLQDKKTAHGICEDYRASRTIDFENDKKDIENQNKIECPMLALWAKNGAIEKYFDPIKEWCKLANNVTGKAINSGHYVAEEAPEEVLGEINKFI